MDNIIQTGSFWSISCMRSLTEWLPLRTMTTSAVTHSTFGFLLLQVCPRSQNCIKSPIIWACYSIGEQAPQKSGSHVIAREDNAQNLDLLRQCNCIRENAFPHELRSAEKWEPKRLCDRKVCSSAQPDIVNQDLSCLGSWCINSNQSAWNCNRIGASFIRKKTQNDIWSGGIERNLPAVSTFIWLQPGVGTCFPLPWRSPILSSVIIPVLIKLDKSVRQRGRHVIIPELQSYLHANWKIASLWYCMWGALASTNASLTKTSLHTEKRNTAVSVWFSVSWPE